jgi:DNA-binding FadR family transcriptional regulator
VPAGAPKAKSKARPKKRPRPKKPSPNGAASGTSKANKPRLAEVVAGQIEDYIVSRGWPVGEILGSEADLIERFDVSRAVFREAVRIIEHHNVARMRRGPGGGLVITEPDPEPVREAMALYLRYNGVDRASIYEALSALELAAVTKAAEMIDEEGIDRLRAALEVEEELGEDAVTQGRAHDLHGVIADLTGNAAMRLFIEVLSALNEEMTISERGPKSRVSLKQATADYHHAHVAIVDAIASGDAALAQHRMRRHLEAVREFSHR